MKNEVYGFLNKEEMNPSPLHIFDFGIECRQNERYDFRNDERGNYEGYLFQYTLDGWGRFENDETITNLEKQNAFFISFPCKSRFLHEIQLIQMSKDSKLRVLLDNITFSR